MLRPRPDGGWTLSGNLAELAGVEFMEIFSWFVEAEWQADWADARARLGDNATTADLQRTEAQRRSRRPPRHGPRRCLHASRIAAAPPDRQRPDRSGVVRSPPAWRNPRPAPIPRRRDPHPERTTPAPRRRHQRRTDRPHPPRRLRRLRHHHRPRPTQPDSSADPHATPSCCCSPPASGSAATDPLRWCDADHSLGWKAHGATVPRNGGGLCQGHNHLKERGFDVFRDDTGDWHVIDPDGNEIT